MGSSVLPRFDKALKALNDLLPQKCSDKEYSKAIEQDFKPTGEFSEDVGKCLYSDCSHPKEDVQLIITRSL